MVTKPTLQELNELTASQNCLVMLRVLLTSDLSFHYMLYKTSTLRNIEEEASNILALDIEHREADSGLSPQEITEYNDYCTQLRKYADDHPEIYDQYCLGYSLSPNNTRWMRAR